MKVRNTQEINVFKNVIVNWHLYAFVLKR